MAITQSDLQFQDGVPQPVPSNSFVTLLVQSGPRPQAGNTSAAITIDHLQVAAMAVPYDPNHNNVQTISAYVPAGSAGFVTLYGRAPYVATLSSWPLAAPAPPIKEIAMKIERVYYEVGQGAQPVKITCDADFKLTILAHNSDPTPDVVQIITPPSTFRTPNASGPEDAMALDIGGLEHKQIGAIGGMAGETISLDGSGNGRLLLYVTVETSAGATIAYSH